ncbi:putative B3 domain-containing protein [Capsicum chacoense]
MSTIKLFGKEIKVEEKEKEKEESIMLFGNRILLHAALNENKKQKQNDNRIVNGINLLPPKCMRMAIRLGGGSRPVYIGRKQVENSDFSLQQSRLLITASTHCWKLLDDLIASEDNDIGVQVRVMDPRCKFHDMKLNRWNSVGRFVFNRGWNSLLKENKLEKGDTLDLWHFETPLNQPCFAINIIKNQ